MFESSSTPRNFDNTTNKILVAFRNGAVEDFDVEVFWSANSSAIDLLS